MKKFLSLVLALVMTMSLVTVSAGAKDFTDNDTITYSEAVNVMSEVGVIDGYTDGSFQPTTNLTRGAAAKIICNLILGPTTAAALGADTAPYSDVPVSNVFSGYIAYCQKEGIISGYADGTFKPAAPLTGYAFMKMLLGALGYESDREGYTGANWSVNVAKQAIAIGLNEGNDEFTGQAYVNREEAMLYAFNTLQATMVEYEQNTSIVVNGDTQVTVQTPAQDKAWGTATLNDGHIEPDGYVQFAEEYFPKLEKRADTDPFERPAHTWTLDGKEIGTYVNYDEMVAEYTTGVSGRDVYNVLTSTTIRDCGFTSYLDGAKGNIAKEDLARSNSDDLADTDNGVLTQVFLDNDDKEIVITSINTYLAQATADYSESKEYAPVKVYTAINDNKDVTEKPYNVDVEDVPEVADVTADTFYQVTVSYKDNVNGEVVSIADVETLDDSTVTKWSYADDKVVSKLTTGGTEYKAAAKAFYDAEELYSYDESLLTDMTYNVYLDQYGYVLGVQLHQGELKYVFITGYDRPKSNLSVSTATAAAIFLDGTMQEIKVNVKATNDNITESDKTYFDDNTDWKYGSDDGNPVDNRWYTYSVNENGVYTLKPADMTITTYADEQNPTNAAAYQLVTIDTANVSVKDSTDNTRVYGEDASVYITVDTDVVDTTTKARAITDVTGVYTGVQSVDLEVENSKKELNVFNDTAAPMPQVYTVYDKDHYIIGAIVVGDATGSTANIVYTLGEAKSEELKDGVYYWEFDAVMNGEIQTLTVKSKYDDVIDAIKGDADDIMELRFDADGYVVKAVNVTDIYDYYDATHDADITKADVYDVVDDSMVINLQGRTLYITAGQDDAGLAIAKDAKAVVIQKENGKTVKTEFDSVDAAVTRLADANTNTPSVLDYDGRIIAVLNSNGTAAWVVFVNNTELVTGTNKPVSGDDTNVAGNVTVVVDKDSNAAFEARDVVTYIDGAGNLKVAVARYNAEGYELTSADITVQINRINAVVTGPEAIGNQAIFTVSGRDMLDTDDVVITIGDCVYENTDVEAPSGIVIDSAEKETTGNDSAEDAKLIVRCTISDDVLTTMKAADLYNFSGLDVDQVVFNNNGEETVVGPSSTTLLKDLCDYYQINFFGLKDASGELVAYVVIENL